MTCPHASATENSPLTNGEESPARQRKQVHVTRQVFARISPLAAPARPWRHQPRSAARRGRLAAVPGPRTPEAAYGVIDRPTALTRPIMAARSASRAACRPAAGPWRGVERRVWRRFAYPQGPSGAARRLSGCPSTGHRRSDPARSALTRSDAAHVADPAVSLPSPRHRLAPVGSGTPGTHPGHPRSVPARPLRARTLCRAYERRVPILGFWVLV